MKYMPSIKKSSQSNISRVIIASFAVPVLCHVTVALMEGRSVPLWSEAPYFVLLVAHLLPFISGLIVIGVVGYLIVRRKIAFVAAISSALLVFGFMQFSVLWSEWARFFVSLAMTLSPAIFYGFYKLLSRTKRPIVDSIVLIVSMLIVLFASTLLALYILRLSLPV